MRFDQRIIRPNSVLVVLGMILGVLCGCAVVGPTSISMGRSDYNEAINKTGDAQMLMSIYYSYVLRQSQALYSPCW